MTQKKIKQWIIALLFVVAITAATSLLLRPYEKEHWVLVMLLKGFILGAACVAAVGFLNRKNRRIRK